MFRIVTARPVDGSARAVKREEEGLLEDILMGEDFADGAGPSRAQAVGGGRIAGPGENIANSAQWMR